MNQELLSVVSDINADSESVLTQLLKNVLVTNVSKLLNPKYVLDDDENAVLSKIEYMLNNPIQFEIEAGTHRETADRLFYEIADYWAELLEEQGDENINTSIDVAIDYIVNFYAIYSNE